MSASPKDFLVDGKWTCTKCGACCAFIAPAVKSGFPKAWVMIDGSCKWLNKQTKGCSIYKVRPNLCRIDQTLKKKHTDEEIAGFCAVMKTHQDEKSAKWLGFI